MRRAARRFIERVVKATACPAPIYEFGSRIVPGQGEMADLRPIFLATEVTENTEIWDAAEASRAKPSESSVPSVASVYHGCDIVPGPNVDELRDVCATGLADGAAGTVVCAELFEHLARPRQAAREIARVLRPGGILIVTTLFKFPIHEYPADYFRFTPQGLASLLEEVGGPDDIHIEHDPLDADQVGVYGWCRRRR